jgi:CBS domain-containing protein
VRQDATLSEVLKTLLRSKIQALVVVSSKTGIPIYTISVMDIVGFVVQKISAEDLQPSVWETAAQFFAGEGEAEAHPLAKKTLAELEEDQDYELDAAFCVMKTDPLLSAVELMVEHNCHRVVVYEDEHFKLNNLITQSRIMAFLNAVVDSVPAAKKTVAESGILGKILHTVAATSPAYLAFKTMQEFKVSAVPVIAHDAHHMIGSISTSDIKMVGYDMRFWKDLALPCSEFLAKMEEHPEYKRQNPVMTNVKSMWSDVIDKHQTFAVCTKDDTIEHVVNLLVAHKVHRLWVVDSDKGALKEPIGVVSLVDVLRLLTDAKDAGGDANDDK